MNQKKPNSAFMVIVLGILVASLVAAPVAARGPTIKDIQPGDTIFVHEEGLNLTQLRKAPGDTPITSLRMYSGNDPDKGVVNVLNVPDDTDFNVRSIEVGDDVGAYYAYNPADGNTATIYIREPDIQIGATLDNPDHEDSIEGISIPDGTAIAFKVTSVHVGNHYRVDDTYPAEVDIVVTTPGGAELTTFGGQDLSGLTVRGTTFYTDDPGYRGPVLLSGLQEGIYLVQARWSAPDEFEKNAEDSNVLTFSVGKRIGIDETETPTPTPSPAPPTPSPTESPVVPTATPTATTPPPEPTAPVTPSVATPTPTTPTPVPTPTPLNILIVPAAVGALLIMRAVLIGRK